MVKYKILIVLKGKLSNYFLRSLQTLNQKVLIFDLLGHLHSTVVTSVSFANLTSVCTLFGVLLCPPISKPDAFLIVKVHRSVEHCYSIKYWSCFHFYN